MSVRAVWIIEADSGKAVPAELHDELSVDVLLDIEDQWVDHRDTLRQQLRTAGVARSQWPQSLHWDWSRKSVALSLAGDADDFRIFGLRRQTAWEGAMLTLRKGHQTSLPPDPGKRLVYVDFLEVAPWNWSVEAIARKRKYKAVGPLLLRAAVEQSYAEGNDGRVGLHALPQAEEFYRSQGFTLVMQDAAKRLPYYELPATGAKVLRKG